MPHQKPHKQLKINKPLIISTISVCLILFLWFILPEKTDNLGKVGEPGEQSQRVQKKTDGTDSSHHRVVGREEKIKADRENQVKKGPAVFGETGMLTTGAAESLGLSQDQLHKVNGLIFKNNKSFESVLAKRSRLNENESDSDKHITVYDIPALEDRGETLLMHFKNELAAELGVASGTKLYDMFTSSPGSDKMFGGYGKYDIKLKFQPPDPAKPDAIAAFFTYSDPASGKWLTKYEMELEKFKELFGETFDLNPGTGK